MADIVRDAKGIESVTDKRGGQPVEQVDNKRDLQGRGEDKVRVRPVRTFRGDEGHKTPDSEPFEVNKSRALELRQNGLVEFESASDESDAHEAVAKAAADAARKRSETAVATGRMKDEYKSPNPLKPTAVVMQQG